MKNLKTSGQCACGHVKFSSFGQPTWTAGCCCKDCSKATGTPYVVWVGFPVDAVKFTDNEPVLAETSKVCCGGFAGNVGLLLHMVEIQNSMLMIRSFIFLQILLTIPNYFLLQRWFGTPKGQPGLN